MKNNILGIALLFVVVIYITYLTRSKPVSSWSVFRDTVAVFVIIVSILTAIAGSILIETTVRAGLFSAFAIASASSVAAITSNVEGWLARRYLVRRPGLKTGIKR